MLVLDKSRVSDIEYSALQMLIEGERRMTASGVEVWLAALNPRVLATVRNTSIDQRLGRERMLFNARGDRALPDAEGGRRKRGLVSRYDSLMTRHLFVALLALGIAAPALAQDRPKIGETITTESGLVYKFTQLGNGPQPQTGDLMVIHGIGTLSDGKEFWNTRTDGSPYEYTLGVDSVIRGFSEGMRHVREGDRLIITMKPELAYGPRERTGIPANSTLVFDYEILAVKPLSVAKLMRDAMAAGTVDEAIAKVMATPNLKDYYVSASSIQAAANAANRKEAGTNEKVLALGLTLLPNAYQLHQTLGRLQATRGDTSAAIKSYETALKLNPKKTATEIRDHETTTAALAALR